MRKTPALLLLTSALAVAAAGCGSSSNAGTTSSAGAGSATTTGTGAGSPSTPTTATSGGVNPNQRETLPPGDIPDTIAYVPYAVPGAGLTVSIPEGWSRTNAPGIVKFTDKLNEVQLFTLPAKAAVTAAAATRTEVPKLSGSVKTFKLQSVTTVSRTAGPAVRIAYLGDSQPDPVTGKVGTLAFERYDFFHKGKEVVLVLSSPNGSDNVDPWRKITNSLTFTR
jgi:hypothetical protein